MNKDPKRAEAIAVKLGESIQEAQRFIDKALVARDQLRTGNETVYHSSSVAAAKRASMDLTKSLAELRRGNKF